MPKKITDTERLDKLERIEQIVRKADGYQIMDGMVRTLSASRGYRPKEGLAEYKSLREAIDACPEPKKARKSYGKTTR